MDARCIGNSAWGYRELKTEKNQSIARNYRGWLCSVLDSLWWNRNKDSGLLKISYLQIDLDSSAPLCWPNSPKQDRNCGIQLSGTVVVNVSLCGDCKMTYERERGPRESYKVLLRRRCIQVLTGESRYNFTHSIHNDDLLESRRVSMTFRQSLSA
ncbi:hypothetical protein L7F22_045162 [Adiantum nelumboides]|nr:hypothetical protein [Adiantum nelumboides]